MSNTSKLLVGIIIFLLVFIGGGYYDTCRKAVNNIEIQVISYDCEYDSYYSVTATIQIRNRAKTSVILSDHFFKLYGLNYYFGRKELEDDWIKLDPGGTKRYSGTFVLLDHLESDVLNSLFPAYRNDLYICVFYQAKVKSGFFTSYIEKNYSTYHERELTKNELEKIGIS